MCNTWQIHLQRTKWCILLLILLPIVPCQAVLQKMDTTYRLPLSIEPIQYNLTVEPHFANITHANFNGSITIKLKVIESTDSITLHAKSLVINSDSIKISDQNGIIKNISNISIDNLRNYYTLHLSECLFDNQTIKLDIGNFSGKLKFDNVGFYLAKYINKFNEERFLALTDFQPIGARKAFPCFDEPALKATFIISVIRQKDFISVSNAELLRTVDLGNGRYQDIYNETVKMSTYLVSFSVSDYNRTVQKGLFRIYAKSDVIQKAKLDLVLSIANDLLKILESYTEIKYSMSKLDMFAVPPEYFEPGGMENWGLITFSENNLICTNESTIEEIRKCTIMTAHEIAHQWFGNLVTPSWWNFLWLSEGFSTYMEYYATSLLNPPWKIMDQFVVSLLQPLLKLDVKGTQYLNFRPTHAGVLPAAYTTYFKGAVIVRMLEHVLTHRTFQLGIRMYLKKYQYGSVTPNELYDAFEQALICHNKKSILGNLTISDIMNTWDRFPGYPLVHIFRNYDQGLTTITQEPIANSNQTQLWIIPINFVTKERNTTTPDLWLIDKSMVMKSNHTSSNWILANKEQTGYYRVNYDLENWKRLTQLLNSGRLEEIPVLNRAQLIDDSFELANFNYVPYDVPLNLSFYLRRETQYIPLLAFFNNVDQVKLYLWSLGKEYVFQNYIKNLLENVYKRLSFYEKDSDDYLDQINRINMITWLCNLNDLKCRQHSLQMMRSWFENNTKLPLNLEIPILCGAMQLASANDWHLLYTKYEEAEDSNRKSKIFIGLGCIGNGTILNNFLDVIFKNNNVSITDKKLALIRIIQIDQSRVDTVFNYFVKYILDISDAYYELKISDVLCKQITSVNHLEVLHMLKLSYPHSNVIRSCLNQVNRNIAWLNESALKNVAQWFENYERNFMK